ncbi:MAG: TonB-dependent receptor [Candidatus Eisenbacteria bacterium]
MRGRRRRIRPARPAAWLLALAIASPALVSPRAAAAAATGTGGTAGADTLAHVVPLPTIEVSALREPQPLVRVPAQTEVFDRVALQRTGATRLSTLLTPLAGLHGYQTGPDGEPTVVDPRGFTANGELSYLKVLVDGVDVRSLETGDVDWSGVVPADAARVEVVGGPGAWLYGDGAEGGIVNVIRGVAPAGFTPRARITTGTFGNWGGDAGAAFGGSKTELDLSGGGRQVDGWRDRSAEKLTRGGAHGRWEAGSRTTVTADATLLDTRREDPGALTPDEMEADRTAAENPGDFTNTKRVVAALGITHGDATSQQWHVAPYYRDERVDQVSTIAFQSPFHHSEGQSYGAEAGWMGMFAPGGHTLQLDAGWQGENGVLDTRYQDWDGSTAGATLADGRGSRALQSAFGGARLELSHVFTLRGGVRGDWLDVRYDDHLGDASQAQRTLHAVSPFVALSARSAGGVSGYLSYGGAFHAPTLRQLFDPRPFVVGYDPVTGPIVITISNGMIDPQRSDNLELGVRVDTPEGRMMSLTVYDMEVRDEIDFDNANFRYANIGSSRHRGLLATVASPIDAGWDLRLDAAATPTTIHGGDHDGLQINAVPEAQASLRLGWAPVAAVRVDAIARWIGRQWLDEANQHPLGEYAMLDLDGSITRSRLELAVRVGNLLDRKVADTGFIGALGEERLVPAAGRNASVTLSFR